MDMVSFDSACRCLARKLERQIPRQESEAKPSPFEGVKNLTEDQKNLEFVSRIRVVKGV